MAHLFTLVISKEELQRIRLMDGKKLSYNPGEYAEANEAAYTVLCNTWLRMCYDLIGSQAARVLFSSILREGVVSTIAECCKLSDDIIRYGEVRTSTSLRALLSEDEKSTLQVLRYGKRFSPLKADKLADEGLNKFLQLNKGLKGDPSVILDGVNGARMVVKRTKEYPRWIIKRLRYFVAQMLGEAPTEEEVNLNGSFSTGATADGCKTLNEKLRAFAKHEVCYKHYTYPLGVAKEPWESYSVCKAVPKSYKTPRIIAESTAYMQYYQQGLRRIATQRLGSSPWAALIKLKDQSINQEWARLGSIEGSYSTIDLSSASDSISRYLAEQIIDRDWFRLLDKWNAATIVAYIRDPKTMKKKKVEYPRYIFQLSGSGSTFVLESIIFLAIALVATEVCDVFNGTFNDWGKRRKKGSMLLPRTFGDDLIVDSRVFDTLCDILGLLGFTVNSEKSFGIQSDYRESCGSEWYKGMDMSTRYFPRKSLDPSKPEFLESLISLQHRLYGLELTEEWLYAYIERNAPQYCKTRMTSSDPGTECDDLWAEFPYYKKVNPPIDHDRITEAPFDIRREVHVTLSSQEVKDRKKWAKVGFTDEDYQRIELYRYVEFLQYGPQYDEYGYSLPPRPVSQDIMMPEVIYTTTIR